MEQENRYTIQIKMLTYFNSSLTSIKAKPNKFSQNPELKTFLLKTNDRIIVEASPVDAIWGIGMAGDHKDVLNPSFGYIVLGYKIPSALSNENT